MPKYEIQIMEICKRTTTIHLEAPDYQTAFENAKSATYGENDFGVVSVDTFPINIKQCNPDIPDDVDVFMANVIDRIEHTAPNLCATCEGIVFEHDEPTWTIRFKDNVIQFVEIIFSKDFKQILSVQNNGHIEIAESLKVTPLNAVALSLMLSR